MEELLKIASIIPAFIILALGVAILISAMNAVFIFAEICSRLSRRILKYFDRYFED